MRRLGRFLTWMAAAELVGEAIGYLMYRRSIRSTERKATPCPAPSRTRP